MEVFFGDRSTSLESAGTVDFPEHLTPFQDPANIVFDACTGAIQPPEVEPQSLTPPQKLRPIRFNRRRPPEFAAVANPGGFGGTLASCESDLGFIPQLSRRSAENGEQQGKIGNSIEGNLYSSAVRQMKSVMDAEYSDIIADGRLFEAELNLSATREPVSRKQKRKTRKTMELFFKNMMKNIMHRQELMHKQLIDMIERKEQERILREEAWKQQEIERAKKEEEVRAQETSRSLALISLIQNMLGDEILVPKSVDAQCLKSDDGKINSQHDFKGYPSNKRWPESEVQALINVRTALDHKFLGGPKGSIWEEVAAGLSKMGYSRSAKKCKGKWENINKYYKRIMENGKKCTDSGKTCPYFQELDILYESGLISSGMAPTS